MKPEDIMFDENLEFYTEFPYPNLEVCVSLSDSLDAYEEVLSLSYRKKIANFINNSDLWYEKALDAARIKAHGDGFSCIKDEDIVLMNIFVLYEQTEDELYGLGFRFNFEVEHGCGIKINTKNFEITEVGDADVAFC